MLQRLNIHTYLILKLISRYNQQGPKLTITHRSQLSRRIERMRTGQSPHHNLVYFLFQYPSLRGKIRPYFHRQREYLLRNNTILRADLLHNFPCSCVSTLVNILSRSKAFNVAGLNFPSTSHFYVTLSLCSLFQVFHIISSGEMT